METILVVLLENLFPIVLSLVSVALITLIRGFLKKNEGKVNLQIKEVTERLLIEAVQQGISFAEQWAHNQSKQMTEGYKVNSNDKLTLAVKYVVNEINRNELPQLAEKQIVEKIESALGINTLNNNSLPDLSMEVDDEDNYIG
jgi:ABC-type lipopolysaccharide export system ATPase subunit